MNDKITDYVYTLREIAYADGHSKVFNIAHAYLQGLEDAGAITQTEHEILFSFITGLEKCPSKKGATHESIQVQEYNLF